jgi:hypothetical protein
MNPRRIEVDCYAGGRADERPRRVIIDGREHIIARLLGSSVEESAATRDRTLRFRVETDEGRVLVIRRDPAGEWYLESLATGPP